MYIYIYISNMCIQCISSLVSAGFYLQKRCQDISKLLTMESWSFCPWKKSVQEFLFVFFVGCFFSRFGQHAELEFHHLKIGSTSFNSPFCMDFCCFRNPVKQFLNLQDQIKRLWISTSYQVFSMISSINIILPEYSSVFFKQHFITFI